MSVKGVEQLPIPTGLKNAVDKFNNTSSDKLLIDSILKKSGYVALDTFISKINLIRTTEELDAVLIKGSGLCSDLYITEQQYLAIQQSTDAVSRVLAQAAFAFSVDQSLAKKMADLFAFQGLSVDTDISIYHAWLIKELEHQGQRFSILEPISSKKEFISQSAYEGVVSIDDNYTVLLNYLLELYEICGLERLKGALQVEIELANLIGYRVEINQTFIQGIRCEKDWVFTEDCNVHGVMTTYLSIWKRVMEAGVTPDVVCHLIDKWQASNHQSDEWSGRYYVREYIEEVLARPLTDDASIQAIIDELMAVSHRHSIHSLYARRVALPALMHAMGDSEYVLPALEIAIELAENKIAYCPTLEHGAALAYSRSGKDQAVYKLYLGLGKEMAQILGPLSFNPYRTKDGRQSLAKYIDGPSSFENVRQAAKLIVQILKHDPDNKELRSDLANRIDKCSLDELLSELKRMK